MKYSAQKFCWREAQVKLSSGIYSWSMQARNVCFFTDYLQRASWDIKSKEKKIISVSETSLFLSFTNNFCLFIFSL